MLTFDGVTVEEIEEVAVPRPREKMPRRGRGMVKTNCRWGTSWQRVWAIQWPVWRTRRWWQEGSRGRGMAALAGEGEELFVTAVGTLQAGEALGKVAAAVELLDDGEGVGAQRPVGLAVGGLVFGEEVVPSMVDNLTFRLGDDRIHAVPILTLWTD